MNYLEIMILCDLTHTMSMADFMVIGVKIPKMDSGCFLDKEFTELICMNP